MISLHFLLLLVQRQGVGRDGQRQLGEDHAELPALLQAP
jgi:hypothetical protein